MYSDTVKHRAIVHYKYFLRSLRQVSSIYNVSKSTLGRWVKKDGIVIPRTKRTSVVDSLTTFVKQNLSSNPFLTTCELSKLMKQELNKNVSKSTVWKCIKACNMTYKRTKPYVYKPSTALLEQSFISKYHDDVISIDETFFYLYDYPRYGYSEKGTLLRKPYSHTPRKKKITLYMAIAKDQIIGYKLSTKHGNTNDFSDFIKSLHLQNKTLIMDNVAFHKTKSFKDMVHSMNNTILYTPPYSPQYNPIELAFSKIKTVYRKLNYVKDDLESNILESIASVSSLDLQAYYKHVNTVVRTSMKN